MTFANVYQPCAALAMSAGTGSLAPTLWPAAYQSAAQNRCLALRDKGMLEGADVAQIAEGALGKMRRYGWNPESDFFHASHYRFATNSIAVTYANAYGRFGPQDVVCGFSFANTDATGAPAPQDAAAQEKIFANGNGIPPTGGVNVVYENSVGGPRLDFLGVSPSTGKADFSLDGALCLRSLSTGRDPATGLPLGGAMAEMSSRTRAGVERVQLTARLRGKPAIIVAGRSDALLPVNHAARAYFGANQILDPAGSNTRYYEVSNAQHFDAFIALGKATGYDAHATPLRPYLDRALDLMLARLREGLPLPPSQVVRATPRGADLPLAIANSPAISSAPRKEDAIGMSDKTLRIPD